MGASLAYGESIIKGIEQNQLGHFLNISILLDFYYKGFFIQSDHKRSDTHMLGAEVGYQLMVEDDWQFDILTKTYIGGFSPSNIMEWQDEYIPILDGLENRSSGDGLGFRYTKYLDDAIFSVDVANLAILSNAEGWVVDTYYSHLTPYRNWDIYFNAGLTLYSQEVMNYYVGVQKHEAREYRPEFEGSTGARAQFEIFAQHPISESWTFNAGFSQSFYTSNVSDSPIVDRTNAMRIMAGVLYVF